MKRFDIRYIVDVSTFIFLNLGHVTIKKKEKKFSTYLPHYRRITWCIHPTIRRIRETIKFLLESLVYEALIVKWKRWKWSYKITISAYKLHGKITIRGAVRIVKTIHFPSWSTARVRRGVLQHNYYLGHRDYIIMRCYNAVLMMERCFFFPLPLSFNVI